MREMPNAFWLWIGAFTIALLAGCANQNSIFRVTDTETNKTETILIDAKQRPITVNTNKDKQKLCLARSADALSQAAASGNLKITQASGGSGELGFADTEQVTSIAFRTQVTEAQQEFLFYLCQLNSNGVLDDGDVSDNLKHFQNTMLAMVAIDDLATAAKAAAPSAKPTAADKTPSDADATKIKSAQTKVDSAKKTQDAAQGTVDGELAKLWLAKTPQEGTKLATTFNSDLKTFDSDRAKFVAALDDLQSTITASKGDSAKPPSDVTKAAAALATSSKTVKAKYGEVSKLLATLIKAQDTAHFDTAQGPALSAFTDYRKATDDEETKAEALQTALTGWVNAKEDSSPKSDPKNAASTESSPTPTAAVAQAVTTIVQTIVWQSFVGEKCQTALFTNFAATDPKMRDFCIKHLEDADAYRFLALKTGALKPGEPFQPLGEQMQELKEMLQLNLATK